jgi:N-methylhydantoinase A/oxoprolinase/acetone carboxylase beta subunit
MHSSQASLCLGIDTGGTYTDGVLLNPQTRQVVKITKVLTTHHDLKFCIAEVLDQLVPEDPARLSFISLSTTLATNAIAEGKRRPVGLLLLGYDPELVYKFNFQEQFGTKHFYFIEGRHGLEGVEEIPLDETALNEAVQKSRKQVDAFAVAAYAGPRNASHEQRAAEMVGALSGLPVIQAHHLSSELDSIRRATTASLNASLLSNLDEFLEAVEQMLQRKGVKAPLLIVRGDGSIVKAGFARTRPVEIIHSGPATSTIGGQFLAGVESALVIDIGGTTTDIALVSGGRSQVMEKSATVGPYRTCVKTIETRSFGLGGDSRIHFDRWGRLSIGPERVLPLSHFCVQFPEIKIDLVAWIKEKGALHFTDELEYWILRREPRRPFSDERTNRAIELLRNGPMRLAKLLKAVHASSPVLLDVNELINQEVIERTGLTPTDILHVTGEYAPWDVEIARLALEAVARNWEEDGTACGSDQLIRRVQETITECIVAETIQFLSGRTLSEPAYQFNKSPLDRWLFDENLAPQNEFLGSKIFLKVPIVGIGAPAKAFLPPVAEALGTTILLPEHYAVANAVGTVVGSVLVRQEADVFPATEGAFITGYYARAGGTQPKFQLHHEAMEYARQTLRRLVQEEAEAAGAEASLVEIQEGENVQGMVHLSAWAVGKPGTNGRAS